MASIFRCTICDIPKFSLGKLLQHVYLIHSQAPNFFLTCQLNSCAAHFSKFESFRKHVHRKHRNLLGRPHDDNASAIEREEANDLSDEGNDDHDAARVPALSPSNSFMQFRKLFSGLKDTLCCFILSMREKHRVPGVVQTDVTENIRTLFEFFSSHYAAILRNHLAKVGVNVEDDDDLNEILSLGECFQHALEAVSSEYKLTNYCKQHHDLV